jgi:hypothetical protein
MTENEAVNQHPPRPQLALAVGIIGHRPNRLPEAARAKVAADIDAVLDGIAAAMDKARQDYSDVFSGKAVLSLVDSLAEGADRMAARALVARADKDDGGLSFVLDAVLPFDRQEFAKDFAEASSRDEFGALVAKARAVLELPGSRDAEAAAYEAAAYTVVDQSDVLMAVWDGGSSHGRGGTTDTIEGAAHDGQPLIVIDAKGVAPPRVCWRGLDEAVVPTGRLVDMPAGDLASGLALLVDALLRPPAAPAQCAHGLQHDNGRRAWRYFAEDAPPRPSSVFHC